MTDNITHNDNKAADKPQMDLNFEDIIPWNGEVDTGGSVRLKWSRNFARVAAAIRQLLQSMSEVDDNFGTKFLRKDQADRTNFILSMLAGAIFGDYKEGESGAMFDKFGFLTTNRVASHAFTPGMLGAGFALEVDKETGNASGTVDYLTVRKKAIFNTITIHEAEHVGGEIVISPAAMIASAVEATADGWKISFRATDAEGRKLYNEFRKDDQARCQTFNLQTQADGTVGNRYWWRLVTAVGDDYIIISKTDCDTNSDIPMVGDNISQLGNRTDKTRQNAQIISAYGTDAPSRKMYQGINSYNLTGKMVWGEFYDPGTGRMKSIAFGDSFIGNEDKSSYLSYSPEEGLKVKGKLIINGTTGDKEITEEVLNGGKLAEDAKKIAEGAKKRLESWAADAVISPLEKRGLEEEIKRIKSDYDNINASYTKYGMAEPAAYNAAYATYNKQLVQLTAKEPETIPIPSDFAANLDAYYAERTKALNAIDIVIKVGAENLLRNTGFTGDYAPVQISSSTVMSADTELYSAKLEHWEGDATVKDDAESASGKAAALGGLKQSVYLVANETHMLSLKAKGTDITISVNGVAKRFNLGSSYQRLELKFTSKHSNTVILSGMCTVCEIKLERGTVATDWCPHRKDRNEIADEFKKFWYLLDALGATTEIDGGMILTTIIRLGQWQDGQMKKINGAISGIYNDDDDVAFCFGGDLDKAINTVKLYREDPFYQPTPADLKNIAKVVVTHGGRAILTDVILRGYVVAEGGIFKNISSPNGSFNIDNDGTFRCNNAHISGEIEATSGTFRNVSSPNGDFRIDDKGRFFGRGGFASLWVGNKGTGFMPFKDPYSSKLRLTQGFLVDPGWGAEVDGKDIVIWNDMNTDSAIDIPEGYEMIAPDGRVYKGKFRYQLIHHSIYYMTSYDKGWIVNNMINIKR